VVSLPSWSRTRKPVEKGLEHVVEKGAVGEEIAVVEFDRRPCRR